MAEYTKNHRNTQSAHHLGLTDGRMSAGPGRLSAARLFGHELLRLRLHRGLSLRGLARQLGMTAHSGLVDYEKGARIPPRDLMASYLRVLAPKDDRLARLYEAALSDRADLRTAASIRPAGTRTSDPAAPPSADWEVPLDPSQIQQLAHQCATQSAALASVARTLDAVARQLVEPQSSGTAMTHRPRHE